MSSKNYAIIFGGGGESLEDHIGSKGEAKGQDGQKKIA